MRSPIIFRLCDHGPGDCTAHGRLPLQFYFVGPDCNAMQIAEQFMYVCQFLKGGCDILRLSESSCRDIFVSLSVVWSTDLCFSMKG